MTSDILPLCRNILTVFEGAKSEVKLKRKQRGGKSAEKRFSFRKRPIISPERNMAAAAPARQKKHASL